jgi:hypothetical protein
MPCLLTIVALLFPRITILVLWIFTHWFSGVFSSMIWPVLGFIFMPLTMLWYSVVINHYGGQWNPMTIAVMVLAVVIDIGSNGSGYKHQRKR